MTARKLDFSKVNSLGGRVAEGEYLAELVKVTEKESKQGNEMIVFDFKIVGEGEGVGTIIVHRQVLLETQLWKYAELLAAFGHNVYGESTEIDPEVLVGNIIGIYAADGEEYRGKVKSEIRSFAPAEAVAPGAAPTIDTNEEDDDDVDLSDLD